MTGRAAGGTGGGGERSSRGRAGDTQCTGWRMSISDAVADSYYQPSEPRPLPGGEQYITIERDGEEHDVRCEMDEGCVFRAFLEDGSVVELTPSEEREAAQAFAEAIAEESFE